MENIEVGLRIRPLNQNEIANFEKVAWLTKNNDILSFDIDHHENVLKLHKTTQINLKNPINFNFCFDEKLNNYDIFEKMIQDVVNSSLRGINGTVFMYGQTGSGKTFTMMGSLYEQMQINHTKSTNEKIVKCKEIESNGIIMYAIKDIYDKIAECKNKNFIVKCSYLEIYNDLVYDLLINQKTFGDPLAINEDANNKEFFIPETNEEIVNNYEEVIDKLYRGEAKRHYASTVLNHISSRSHTIFRLFIKSVQNSSDQSKECITESILNFVDLAGSEKLNYQSKENVYYEANRNTTPLNKFSSPASKEKKPFSAHFVNSNSKERFKESQHINKSLFFLTSVISLISQGKKETHIPYRNSPLTKILKGSLGGNSRTKIILCINPCLSQLEQSVNTIRFGLCAKKIQNNIKVNCIYRNKTEVKASVSTETKKTKIENRFQMHSDRKLIRNLFSLEKIEKQNKELMNNNIQINEKSTKISKKMKKLQKNQKKLKQENIIYKLMIKMCSGENPSDFLKFLPIEILEILENNLNLTIDQIKLQKILKDVNFSTTNDSFRPYFMDILEQKINNYTKQIESKRRIPCDLLKELEKNSIFRDITNKNPKNEKILIRGLSSNENSEENLLSNVSHLYEEKFDIEHIID